MLSKFKKKKISKKQKKNLVLLDHLPELSRRFFIKAKTLLNKKNCVFYVANFYSLGSRTLLSTKKKSIKFF